MSKSPALLESQEASILVAWLRVHNIAFSHIPGETGHDEYSKRRAIRMKQQGTSKGFPDYIVALPGTGLLAIELKRSVKKLSRTSPEQLAWIETLNKCPGVEARVCYGAESAIAFIGEYFKINSQLESIDRANKIRSEQLLF